MMTWLGAEPVWYRLASEYFRFKYASFKLLLSLIFFRIFQTCNCYFVYHSFYVHLLFSCLFFLSRFFFVCF